MAADVDRPVRSRWHDGVRDLSRARENPNRRREHRGRIAARPHQRNDSATDTRDVLAYYRFRASDSIRTNPDLFDYDGDGVAGTVFDALTLFEELTDG